MCYIEAIDTCSTSNKYGPIKIFQPEYQGSKQNIENKINSQHTFPVVLKKYLGSGTPPLYGD